MLTLWICRLRMFIPTQQARCEPADSLRQRRPPSTAWERAEKWIRSLTNLLILMISSQVSRTQEWHWQPYQWFTAVSSSQAGNRTCKCIASRVQVLIHVLISVKPFEQVSLPSITPIGYRVIGLSIDDEASRSVVCTTFSSNFYTSSMPTSHSIRTTSFSVDWKYWMDILIIQVHRLHVTAPSLPSRKYL